MIIFGRDDRAGEKERKISGKQQIVPFGAEDDVLVQFAVLVCVRVNTAQGHAASVRCRQQLC